MITNLIDLAFTKSTDETNVCIELLRMYMDIINSGVTEINNGAIYWFERPSRGIDTECISDIMRSHTIRTCLKNSYANSIHIFVALLVQHLVAERAPLGC